MKKSKARISVIVPVYNQEKYLNQCVDTILSNTFEDFECILVDDGSKDMSPQICDEYARKDARIKVIHKENGGLTSARKAGFEIATGEYVLFEDSDDYVASDLLEKLVNACEENAADVAVCGHFQDDNGRIIEDTFDYGVSVIEKPNIISDYVLPTIGKIYAKGYTNYPGYVWSRLYRRECISEKCFVSEREVYTEDDLFQMFLAKNINKVVFIKDKLCYYRENQNSLTHVYRKNMFQMLKNRHKYVEQFFEKCEDIHKDRIVASAYYAIYVSITNAFALEDKKAFINEISEVRKDSFAIDAMKSMKVKLLRPKQIACYYLFKWNCIGAIYDLRKVLF